MNMMNHSLVPPYRILRSREKLAGMDISLLQDLELISAYNSSLCLSCLRQYIYVMR